MVKSRGIREASGDKVFVACNYVFLSLVLIIVLYPLIFILSSSFSSGDAIIAGKVWLYPVHITLDGFQAVFRAPGVLNGFLNSFFYMIFGTAISVVLTVMMAYPISRKDLYGRRFFTLMILVTMLFNGGLIPFYLQVKSLGLLNTRFAMLLPSALAVWQVIIARTYFQMNIPGELSEAAELDGCSDLNFMLRVVLPLSKPILAVLALMYAIGQWNGYFNALIFLDSSDLFPLQLILRKILILNSNQDAGIQNVQGLLQQEYTSQILRYSLIVVASVPVLILYPFAQKYFVKGTMIGSLKE